MHRLACRLPDGAIALVRWRDIFYLEAQGDDTLVRTRSRRPIRAVQPLTDLSRRLPSEAFLRCHREYVVNLDHVRALVPRTSRDYDFRIDPPVNHRIPIARSYLPRVRRRLRC